MNPTGRPLDFSEQSELRNDQRLQLLGHVVEFVLGERHVAPVVAPRFIVNVANPPALRDDVGHLHRTNRHHLAAFFHGVRQAAQTDSGLGGIREPPGVKVHRLFKFPALLDQLPGNKADYAK